MRAETMITELRAVAEKHKNDFVPTFQTNITAMCRDIIPKLEQLAEYEAIGTVEECREAREKQRGKKPEWSPDCEECEKDGTLDCTYKYSSFSTLSSVLVCPNCKKQRAIKEHGHRYCNNCGQAIDWSDTP